MFQDRSNTEEAIFNPSNHFGEGTIYVPSGHVLLNPSADSTIQLVADTVKINNSGSFTAVFDSEKFFQGGGADGLKLLE